jgi:nucleotide-binding universal stress UspA family protein
MLQKILIAIGDAPESVNVLNTGLSLAEKFKARVLLLHVLNPLVPNGLGIADSPLVGGVLPIVNDASIRQYIEEWKKYELRGMERLQSVLRDAEGLGLEAEILQSFGDVGPMICDAAKNWSAEAIVMGRNQQSALNEFILGSTSNYVLHHAFCSVLIIRSQSISP